MQVVSLLNAFSIPINKDNLEDALYTKNYIKLWNYLPTVHQHEKVHNTNSSPIKRFKTFQNVQQLNYISFSDHAYMQIAVKQLLKRRST